MTSIQVHDGANTLVTEMYQNIGNATMKRAILKNGRNRRHKTNVFLCATVMGL